jgi:hypothetical protein
METSVRKLFERYEQTFNRSLSGKPNLDEVAALYASSFITSSPAGLMTGKNDDQLKRAMARGYERYRAIGTKEMRIREVRLSPIDEHHCVAHVSWRGTWARKNGEDVTLDFDVHYFIRKLGKEPKVFGWVSGDEQAQLSEHAIV